MNRENNLESVMFRINEYFNNKNETIDSIVV